jgi:hypothetical protein
MDGEVRSSGLGDVQRAIVQDHMRTPNTEIASDKLAQCAQEVLMVIGFRITPPHRTHVDVQPRFPHQSFRNNKPFYKTSTVSPLGC